MGPCFEDPGSPSVVEDKLSGSKVFYFITVYKNFRLLKNERLVSKGSSQGSCIQLTLRQTFPSKEFLDLNFLRHFVSNFSSVNCAKGMY